MRKYEQKKKHINSLLIGYNIDTDIQMSNKKQWC